MGKKREHFTFLLFEAESFFFTFNYGDLADSKKTIFFSFFVPDCEHASRTRNIAARLSEYTGSKP